jgi:hypothetical protein
MPLHAIITSSVHLGDISLSFLLYSKILAVVIGYEPKFGIEIFGT